MPVSDNEKKNPKSYSSSQQAQPPRLPPRLPRRRCRLPARRTPGTQGGWRPLHPHRLPAEKAAGRGSSSREGKGTGARRALSDNDRGFMINLGRFKYLLSQGFQGGEESPSPSQSCHLLTSGQCQPNSLIFTEEMRRPLCRDLK